MRYKAVKTNPLLDALEGSMRHAKRLLRRQPEERTQKYEDGTPDMIRSQEFRAIVLDDTNID